MQGSTKKTVDWNRVLLDWILKYYGRYKMTGKGFRARNCPVCTQFGHRPDTRQRFGLKIEQGRGFGGSCFNCGFKFRYEYSNPVLSKKLKMFLKALGVPDKEINKIKFGLFEQANGRRQEISELQGTPFSGVFNNKRIAEIDKANRTEEQKKKRKEPQNSKESLDVMREELAPITEEEIEQMSLYDNTIKLWNRSRYALPAHAKPFSWYISRMESGAYKPTDNFVIALEYIAERDLTNLDDFYWTEDFQDDARNRIIIPYHWANRIVGYTARSIWANKKSVKYFTQGPDDFIYNYAKYHRNYSYKYAVIYEGVLDAYTMHGMSCGSNNISDRQAHMINALGKQVILVPDADEASDIFVETALRYGWSVSIPKWQRKYKDAAAAAEVYGRIHVLQDILESVETNGLSIRLKRGLNG